MFDRQINFAVCVAWALFFSTQVQQQPVPIAALATTQPVIVELMIAPTEVAPLTTIMASVQAASTPQVLLSTGFSDAPTPSSAPTAATTPIPNPQTTLTLTSWLDGLTRPTYLTPSGELGRLYVSEQAGRILLVENGKLRDAPFLDIHERVRSYANEQGLLSVAFSPNYTRDNAVWVNYTDTNGDTTVSKFSVDRQHAIADPASEQIVLSIRQPYSNHNGGQIRFGPDRMLYIGMGDGGSQGDPQGNAQNMQSQLGKLLRIDVLSKPLTSTAAAKTPYLIPKDNPFANDASTAEVWALGLRNPWRFSFDRLTNDLFIADVGQSAAEEIDWQPANSKGGENYGWNAREGFDDFRGGEDRAEFKRPIHTYGRSDGCSIIGGHVYRGAKLPSLQGAYVYGDYCSGRIWALLRSANGAWQNVELFDTDYRISSFAEDADGELYVIDLNGVIYKLVGNA